MKEKGATLLELITVIGIFATLFGIVTINVLNPGEKASLQGSFTTLISDIKQQQIKAIAYDAEGDVVTKDHGIYFSQNSYTLFSGTTYISTSSSNFVVALGNNVEFSSVLFPNQAVVFAKGTGEIVGYNPDMDTITIKNKQNNETKTVQVNRLGVITDIN